MFRVVARHCRRLHADREGQSMPIIVVSLILLVVFSVAVINTGVHVSERQQMQTAVDATAYSGAAVKAKGMNLIAGTNLLLEALMTIRVISEITRDVVRALASATTGLCPLTPLCPLHVLLRGAALFLTPVVNAAVEAINFLMSAIVVIAAGIRIAIPFLAAVTAFRIAERNRADGALIWPVVDPLPVSKASRVVLCRRVAENFGDALTQIPVLDRALRIGLVRRAVEAAMRALVMVYCDGGAAASVDSILGDILGDKAVREEKDCGRCRTADGFKKATYKLAGGNVIMRPYRYAASTRSWAPSGPERRLPLDGEAHAEFTRSRDPGDPAYYEERSSRPRRNCPGVSKAGVLNSFPRSPADGDIHEQKRYEAYFRFHSCSVRQKPQGSLGRPSSNDCQPTPHLLADSNNRDACSVTEPADYQTLLDEGKFDVAAVAWLSLESGQLRGDRYRPLAGVLGDEGSRYITVAKAQFYSQEGHDMWHMDWRARLIRTEFPPFDLNEAAAGFGDSRIGIDPRRPAGSLFPDAPLGQKGRGP